jgi:hypothetical protein
MNKVNYAGNKGLSGKTIGLAVAVVVVLAAVVAVVTSSGSDSVSTDTTLAGPTTTGADGAVVPAETQPVQYDGTLPMFDASIETGWASCWQLGFSSSKLSWISAVHSMSRTTKSVRLFN